MPKNKKLESSSDSDSGPEDRNPAKKAKSDSPAKSSSSSSKPKSGGSGGGGGEESWKLDKNRVVRINEFKGRVFVDIRELYMDASSGELRPGKKGISLTVEQYRKLKEAIPDIDEALKNK